MNGERLKMLLAKEGGPFRLKMGLFCLVGLVLLASVGCNSRPAALPKPYPTTVTVTNSGTPVEGVKVSLFPDVALPTVTIYGTTDASGKAEISSLCASKVFSGAPQGTYKVTLSKTPEVDIPEEYQLGIGNLPQDEVNRRLQLQKEFLDDYRIIPAEYETTESTPLTLTVEKKGVLAVDIAAGTDTKTETE